MARRCHNVLCVGEGVLLGNSLESASSCSCDASRQSLCCLYYQQRNKSGSNQTVTYKGTCEILDDDETKAWFYPALAEALNPADEQWQKNFAGFLDSPGA